MDEWLDDFVADMVTQLEEMSKASEQDDRGLIYSAARVLRAFNELFAMTWRDVEMAEEIIRERGKSNGRKSKDDQPAAAGDRE